MGGRRNLVSLWLAGSACVGRTLRRKGLEGRLLLTFLEDLGLCKRKNCFEHDIADS